MVSLVTSKSLWNTRATKLSSFVDWKRARRNQWIYFRVLSIQINRMAQLRRRSTWKKNKPFRDVLKTRRGEGGGLDGATNIRKVVTVQLIAIYVVTGDKVCWYKPLGEVVIFICRKVYIPPLIFTYNETEISENLNYGMELVFRDYGRSLKLEKDPVTTSDDMMDLYVSTDDISLEKNL